jgi:branched-chain amino acid aminotransferase group I
MNNLPMDQRDGFIWYNGNMTPWKEAKIHVLTHGLHYASSVFEGLRVYSGKIFKLKKHIERLHNSANILGFSLPFSVDELMKATEEVTRIQNIQNGYIRPFAWSGSEKLAACAPENTIHVAIACWETNKIRYFGTEEKIRLTVSDWVRPHPKSAPTESKAAGNYMISSLSKRQAIAKGYSDALLLDYRGYIAEASVANFFLVINGELHTPTPDCFLNGITRQTVIELAKKRNIKVIERHIKPEELAQGQAAFITGTAVEIVPVSEIDQYQFEIDTVTKTLMEDYRNLILAN